MHEISSTLKGFISDATQGHLKTAHYPKEYDGLAMKVSFGMGVPARVPWIGFVAPEMRIQDGIYPVYLFYKELQTLILAYGVSETEQSSTLWPNEVLNDRDTIQAHFDMAVPRYGDSFVFRSYKVIEQEGSVMFTTDAGASVSDIDLDADLNALIDYYKSVLSMPQSSAAQALHTKGLFYMEKQLEDFIIHNWHKTALGEKCDLIVEEGVLLSQQYKTDIGYIDILAKDKETGGYVVIELKRDQTSDDTVGQVARYMGWVRKELAAKDVRGIIIAGTYDKKLDYALAAVPSVEVFLYQVDFKLNRFTA